MKICCRKLVIGIIKMVLVGAEGLVVEEEEEVASSVVPVALEEGEWDEVVVTVEEMKPPTLYQLTSVD